MPVQPWKRVDPTIATKIDRRDIVLKTFEQPDGRVHSFATYLAEGCRAGAVIALTPDNQVIVARQYRPGPEKIMDEIPGGGLEPGEDPQAGALRELREETGYVSNDVTFLGISGRDAYTNAEYYYYLARDCQMSEEGQELDEHEYVEVVLVSIDQFIQSAKNNMMTDPAAVLLAYDTLIQLKENAHA